MQELKHTTSQMPYVVPSPDHPSVNPDSNQKTFMHRFVQEPKTTKSAQHNHVTRWHGIVQNFLRTSTLHGVNHLLPPCSRAQRWFWLSAMLACGTFLLIHASVLVYNAATRPSLSTTLTLKYRELDGPLVDVEKITKFPGITICGLSPFKRSDSDESMTMNMYQALSLGYPYSGLTLGEKILLYESINKPDSAPNSSQSLYKTKLQEFTTNSTDSNFLDENAAQFLWDSSYNCTEVFIRCSVGFETFNCCDFFFPVLTTFGYCYSLQINTTFFGVVEMETMPFIFDLNVPRSTVTDSEEGYLLLVHDPRFTPRMILPKDGLLVAPGVTVSLRLTLRITDYSAKYAKWFGLKIECPVVACMGEDYSVQECVFQNAAVKIRDICNCSWILDVCDNKNEKLPICGPEQMVSCVIKESTILSDLLTQCQPPCMEYIFEPMSSFAQLRYNYSVHDRSRVSISYNTISYYHNIYHKHYLSSLFSDIGGAMGLLLGASCLTGVELLTFLGQWIYYSCVRNRG